MKLCQEILDYGIKDKRFCGLKKILDNLAEIQIKLHYGDKIVALLMLAHFHYQNGRAVKKILVKKNYNFLFKDLFNQSIQMSGSIYSGWAISDSVIGSSRIIAKILNCPLNSKKMKICLKRLPAHEISIAGSKLVKKNFFLNFKLINFIRLGNVTI